MKKIIKKILLFSLCLISLLLSCSNAQNAPTYDDNFANYFIKGKEIDGDKMDVVNFSGISSEKTFEENIRCLFYPGANGGCETGVSSGGYIWSVLRYLGYALVVLFIVISGIKLLISGSDSEKVKTSLKSLLYIILGAILFFGCIWILGSVLDLEDVQGTSGLAEGIEGNSGSLLFFVLSFAKAFAFIAAILMIVIYGFKMMSNADTSDKVKAGLKGLLNVIVALVIIKLIDYVYYIAQLNDLVTKTTYLIVEIAKILGFIIGALMVIMVFYAGFLFITDQGNGEKMKKATNVIIGILVTAVVIFSLLLIIYEIFKEFA